MVCYSSAEGLLYHLNLDGKVMGQYELNIFQDLVAWSVLLGPCNKLYITVDHAYEVPSTSPAEDFVPGPPPPPPPPVHAVIYTHWQFDKPS